MQYARHSLTIILALTLAACGSDLATAPSGDAGGGDGAWHQEGDTSSWHGDTGTRGDHDEGGADDDIASGGDTVGGDDTEPGPYSGPCNLSYDFTYPQPTYPLPAAPRWVWDQAWPTDAEQARAELQTLQVIAHAELAPPGYWLAVALDHTTKDPPNLVMPAYTGDLPLFERAEPWAPLERRCFELPDGDSWLSEAEAFALYADIAALTTGVSLTLAPGERAVVGVRGAHPGQLSYNGNWPDRYNDTLALLWRDADGTARVLEFAAHTDTGDWDFGVDASSSLRPNRRYHYRMGWHRGYNALAIAEVGYQVRDDGNNNGHWDDDRNAWWPPTNGDQDRYRIGSAHNIHANDRSGSLGTAAVATGSAGCQTIPGIASWTRFITTAWTFEGDELDYFLVDARDIDHRVWSPCTPDGSHACPWVIPGLPFTDSADTGQLDQRVFDVYNCSTANEAGPEVVYLLTLDQAGTLAVTVETTSTTADPDIHLLHADDANACLARGHEAFSWVVDPGRYVLVVDSWVDGGGTELSGPYTLTVEML